MTAPKYNWEQRVFCLSMAAMTASMLAKPGDEAEVESSAAGQLINLLSAKQALIGRWTIVWGPEVFQYDEPGRGEILPDVGKSEVADNLVYMVKSQQEPGRYVIAIAGTNINSLYNWFIEDLSVGTARHWNSGKPWEAYATDNSPGERVSEGVSEGLRIINSMISKIEAPQNTTEDAATSLANENVKTLVGYLSDLVSQQRIKELTICGHSLGGALAPLLALSLEDRRDEWDSEHKVKIKVSASAGFSPGNQEFAWYYDGKLGNATRRIWNSRDLVPKGWSQITLEEAKTMYQQQGGIQTNEYINGFIEYMKGLTKNVNYQQICDSQNGFNAAYIPTSIVKSVDEVKQKLNDSSAESLSSTLRAAENTKDQTNAEKLKTAVEGLKTPVENLTSAIVGLGYVTKLTAAGADLDTAVRRINEGIKNINECSLETPLKEAIKAATRAKNILTSEYQKWTAIFISPTTLRSLKLMNPVIIASVLRKLTQKSGGDIRVEIKELFNNLKKLDGTLGDRPTTPPLPTLTTEEWTKAQQLSKLIDELLPKLELNAHGLTGAALHGEDTGTADQLFGLLKYVWQAYYQHTTAYFIHLGVLAFLAP